MRCPHCQTDSRSQVLDSRDHTDWWRRRRKCLICGKMYTTYEQAYKDGNYGPPEAPLPTIKVRKIEQLANGILNEIRVDSV